MTPDSLPAARRCAAALGLGAQPLRELDGRAGQTFAVGEQVLRLVPRPDDEAGAMVAAAAAVPVPRVLGRVDLDDCAALLLERLPGRPAGELATDDPELAARAGRSCGRLHERLATIAAPPRLGTIADAPTAEQPRLLHLDLHPFNVLVGDDGEVTGVIDWANAAAGDPLFDRARTWSILTLDPSGRRRAAPGWIALVDAWVAAGGLSRLPADARAWAARFMLEDLAGRVGADELAPVARALADAERG